MIQDFGPGLTADELIGMNAWQIARLPLPQGRAFEIARQGAEALTRAGAESHCLEELWADGHSVWRDVKTQKPVVVSPNGQIIQENG